MTCAKRRVICTIVTEHFRFIGENLCDNPQTACPHSPGEDYTKCKEICGQRGHAEERALEAAQDFGVDLKGCKAIVTGIHHVCRSCANALYNAGIAEVVVRHER